MHTNLSLYENTCERVSTRARVVDRAAEIGRARERIIQRCFA